MMSITAVRSAPKPFVFGLAVVVACLFATNITKAVTKNFNTSGTGNWNTGSNWGPPGVPGTGDAVNIKPTTAGNYTVNYDYPGPAVTLDSLLLNASITPFSSPTLTFSMAANNLSVFRDETVGEGFSADISGVATFNQSGGTNSTTNLYFGYEANGHGFYDLSGTGVLIAPGDFLNFGEVIGFSGQGQFTQTSGTNQAGTLNVGYDFSGVGIYFLSGSGSLSVNFNELVGASGTGTFQQSGGTNTAVGAVLLGQGMASTGTYTSGELQSHFFPSRQRRLLLGICGRFG